MWFLVKIVIELIVLVAILRELRALRKELSSKVGDERIKQVAYS
jgi:hypothetical protein